MLLMKSLNGFQLHDDLVEADEVWLIKAAIARQSYQESRHMEDGRMPARCPKVLFHAVFGVPRTRVSELSVVKPHVHHHKIL